MSKTAWTLTITFQDGSTRTRTYATKREALAEERRALMSRIVLTAKAVQATQVAREAA